jgi:hypothetical protein
MPQMTEKQAIDRLSQLLVKPNPTKGTRAEILRTRILRTRQQAKRLTKASAVATEEARAARQALHAIEAELKSLHSRNS